MTSLNTRFTSARDTNNSLSSLSFQRRHRVCRGRWDPSFTRRATVHVKRLHIFAPTSVYAHMPYHVCVRTPDDSDGEKSFLFMKFRENEKKKADRSNRPNVNLSIYIIIGITYAFSSAATAGPSTPPGPSLSQAVLNCTHGGGRAWRNAFPAASTTTT